ncbi:MULTISPECIES: sugar-binding transcriptional regulator [Rhizobium]|jgi:DNA-binding transcriptional regulator LsrR (DeoR family)|uniref:DNA-binding transcriptional regulator LsrR, DeoR family n=1 Tax=Rhizobium lusitanum TaxID=293958 RepID=A0A1C3UY72_9HYPH|nr:MULTISPECIES: sugar-binding transcriptional regulator [Rhizobium]NRP86906.1 Transcriptional regulator LsrR [Ensifer adhaerens]NKJ03181.1 DNA-binding transcriptional regulator LsrR (DeoR family) [Rhizobium sp. SG741]NKJ33373.1 DNA-binding transcriptional regulator LsrR (DeoR family) [Rhizobium sp. SG570]NTJ08407.1 sugar-binding transcriptional regulator [Rhizobium lusitanum]SCB20440.1 DNA-binding transcriptional regulator LsrR, DeoR family [Rhizobium lusitanum]
MAKKLDSQGRLDDAARAGWLYYVAGRTQDEIAVAMGISRQSAQRLVSLAVAERLIKVRLDHPIAACLEYAAALREKFNLRHVDVVPSDPDGTSSTIGIAQAGAAEIERWLRRSDPIVLAIGTGRTLKAAVDQLPAIECLQHRVVSLTGNIGPDGSAAYYNVIFSMADVIKARHFPMPLPVLVSSAGERELLHAQALVRSTLDISAQADVTFVGIGEMGIEAPLCLDGFLEKDEMLALMKRGAAGEICGWVFDGEGKLMPDDVNDRVASAPLPSRDTSSVIGIAKGRRKFEAIKAAVVGRQINGLITDEAVAEFLLRA